MIKNISINNFKSIKSLSLSLNNLNIFSGLNGSGKSSFLQGLLLLRQSFNIDLKKNIGLIIQNEETINLGTGKDIFYQYAGKDEKIEFEIIDISGNKFYWSFLYIQNNSVLPNFKNKYDENNKNECSLFNYNFQYLNTEHISPDSVHLKDINQIEKYHNIGIKGEYAVHYLSEFGLKQKIEYNDLLHNKASSDSLIHQVDAWLSEISPGTKLIISDISEFDLVTLSVAFETEKEYTNPFKPINVGFGITYVLPVVLSILKAKKGDILILENPESHLHPKGQSAIGKLIAYAAQNGVQIFVETHSDHIINGIRVAVKQKRLQKENIKMFYFERYTGKSEQHTISYEILVDENGELSNYPQGFLDEWDEQLIKLI